MFRYKVFPNLFWGVGTNAPDSAQENYNQTEIMLSVALDSLPFTKVFHDTVCISYQNHKGTDHYGLLFVHHA